MKSSIKLCLALSATLVLSSCPQPDQPPPPPGYSNGEVRWLQSSGSLENKINMVLLGDGFTAPELIPGGSYDKAAEDLTGLILTTAPFSWMKEEINILQVYTYSRQSGADPSPDTDTVDTAFGSTFGFYGIDRLLVAQNGENIRNALTNAAGSPEKAHIPIIFVNSTKNGGSGGQVAVTSLNPAASLVLLHEVGHSFGGLADEYVDEAIKDFYSLDYLAFYPNVDTTGDPAKVKWKDFLNLQKYRDEGTGTFEGGYYRQKGIWRPSATSIMQTLTSPYFNPPGRYALARRLTGFLASGELTWEEFLLRDSRTPPGIPSRRDINAPMPVPRNLYLVSQSFDLSY